MYDDINKTYVLHTMLEKCRKCSSEAWIARKIFTEKVGLR